MLLDYDDIQFDLICVSYIKLKNSVIPQHEQKVDPEFAPSQSMFLWISPDLLI